MESRTTIRLNAELAKRAKRAAARRQITFTRLVEDALREHLAKPHPTAQRERIELPSFGDPVKKLKWDDVQRQIEQQQLANDVASLGLTRKDRDAAA